MKTNYDLPVYRITWPGPGLCAFAFAAGLYAGAWLAYPLAMLVLTLVAALPCALIGYAACVVGGACDGDA